jgi:hypothetical protein
MLADLGGIDPEICRELYRGRNLTITTSVADLDIVEGLPGVPSYAELPAVLRPARSTRW